MRIYQNYFYLNVLFIFFIFVNEIIYGIESKLFQSNKYSEISNIVLKKLKTLSNHDSNIINENNTNYLIKNKTENSIDAVEAPCEKNCYNNGYCRNGKCYCLPGYTGNLCSEYNHKNSNNKECLNDCSSHGNCLNGQCICYKNYGGNDCSISIFINKYNFILRNKLWK